MKTKYIALAIAAMITGVVIASCTKEQDKESIEEEATPSSSEQRPAGGFDENGASNSVFSVSADKKVRFSKGNLHWYPYKWSFAEKQYQYKGIYSNVSNWKSHFGWACSGWNNGASACQPYSHSGDPSDYAQFNSVTGDNAKGDWAWNNPIENGGNRKNMWRTLTHTEWNYLLNSRSGAHNKRSLATVCGVHGLIILPDNFTQPSGVNFSYNDLYSYSNNTYTEETWQKMEDAGAIFLPAAGYRWMSTVSAQGTEGYYWTASKTRLCFVVNHCDINYVSSSPVNGYSVRPVMDVQ